MTNLLADSLDLPTFWFWNQMHCLNLSQVYFGHIWATLFCYRCKLLWMKHNCFYSAGQTYKNLEITILKEILEVKQKYLVTITILFPKLNKFFTFLYRLYCRLWTYAPVSTLTKFLWIMCYCYGNARLNRLQCFKILRQHLACITPVSLW